MGKALSGELSCPCDRSCYTVIHIIYRNCPFTMQSFVIDAELQIREGNVDNSKTIFLISMKTYVVTPH